VNALKSGLPAIFGLAFLAACGGSNLGTQSVELRMAASNFDSDDLIELFVLAGGGDISCANLNGGTVDPAGAGDGNLLAQNKASAQTINGGASILFEVPQIPAGENRVFFVRAVDAGGGGATIDSGCQENVTIEAGQTVEIELTLGTP
jgi:hypothetical protein